MPYNLRPFTDHIVTALLYTANIVKSHILGYSTSGPFLRPTIVMTLSVFFMYILRALRAVAKLVFVIIAVC